MTTEVPKLTVIDNPTYQPRDPWEEVIKELGGDAQARWAVEMVKRMTPEQCQQFFAILERRLLKEHANA
jgi:hypothetical protein